MLMAKKGHTFHFFKRFLRNPAGVGAIIPSSKRLTMAMVDDLDLSPGDVILELGPGSGAFTHCLQQIIPNTDDYIGIEKDPHFFNRLKKLFPEMRMINDRAENAPQIIERLGLKKPKVIVSSLPFANKKKEVRDQIINSLKAVITPNTLFRTYQYVHSYPFPTAIRFRSTMTEIFGPYHKSKMVFRNLPPAYVLTWSHQ